jgi:Cys-rich protein (TIGR01571 family)
MLNPNNPAHLTYQTFPTDSSKGLPPDWNKGLFTCFDDLELCCFTFCCHCFQYAKVSEKFNQNEYWSNCLIYTAVAAFLTPCLPIFMGKFREDIRAKYQLPGSFGEDCCTHCLCHCCALIQETKEVELREGKFN